MSEDNVVSVEEYRALVTARAARKYRNEPVVVDGESFDSTGEAARYGELKLLEREGKIAELRRQEHFRLEVGGVHIADYVADFTYQEPDPHGLFPDFPCKFVVEDYKGVRTPAYRLKKRLMLGCHGIAIRETGRE